MGETPIASSGYNTEHTSEGGFTPFLSVVVPVYNDWRGLVRCIDSICCQFNPPSFEVIAVDDGSDTEPPQPTDASFVTILRQPHLGVSHARNCGATAAAGTLLLFIDSDCVLEPNCLAELERVFRKRPHEIGYQLKIAGDLSTLVGRVEGTTLHAEQSALLRPDGHIRWLNTSGFAMARSLFGRSGYQFDLSAKRAQDTFLLSEFILRDQLPFFAADCAVHHCVGLGLWKYLCKGFRTTAATKQTYSRIESRGVRVHATASQRFRAFKSLVGLGALQRFGVVAVAVALVRYALTRFGFAVAGYTRSPS